MDITAAVQEHRMLVSQRAQKVALFQSGQLNNSINGRNTPFTPEDFDRYIKPLESRIGHLAQAFNPRIAVKAQQWLTKGA